MFTGPQPTGDHHSQRVIRSDQGRVVHLRQFQDVEHAADCPGGAKLERLDDARVIVEKPRQRGDPADGTRGHGHGREPGGAGPERRVGLDSHAISQRRARPGSSRSAGSGRTVAKANCRVRQSSIRFGIVRTTCRVCTRSISNSSVPVGLMPRDTPRPSSASERVAGLGRSRSPCASRRASNSAVLTRTFTMSFSSVTPRCHNSSGTVHSIGSPPLANVS